MLKAFIMRKGFKEPGVMLEILDHFACKVEEQLETTPQISLEQAMEKAHRSFGVAGFYPLAKAFYGQVQLRYKKVYRQAQKAVLTQLSFWFFAMATLVVYVPAWITCEQQGFRHVLELNDATALVLLAFLAAGTYDLVRRRKFSGNTFFDAVQEKGDWPLFVLVVCIELFNGGAAWGVWGTAVNAGLLITITFLLMVRSKVQAAARDEQAQYEQAAAEY